MTLRVDLTSPDVDKQAELLKFYPEVVVKHYKPALLRINAGISNVVIPRIPELSGRAKETFGSKVTGKQLSTITARIGWYDKDDPFYVRILEAGAKGHPIEPKKKVSAQRYRSGGEISKSLRFMDGGDFVFRGKVSHPGISKVGMLAAGMSAAQGIIALELQQAGEAVLREMEVK
jgi:hypothetical protein